MYQNNLTQRYQSHLNQPIQFMNNQMLNSNPIYSSNIYDQNFYQQMMLQREEQMRKIKNISDLGLTKEKITEYVIAPIKVEKSDKNEVDKLIGDEEQRLTEEFIKDNWWSQRTNAPYKNILKDQDWRKAFKTETDLIVHKYTDLDKVGLMNEYEILLKLIEEHNGDLKVIFSASKESEHKKAFKFVEKYRKRVKYNPKDYNELKEYYSKEQKKFDREQNRIENLISRIMDEDVSEKEMKQIEHEYIKQTKAKKTKSKSKEKEIDRQLQELIDEFGEDVLKELENDEIFDDDEQPEKPKNEERKDRKDRTKDKAKIKGKDKESSKESSEEKPKSRQKKTDVKSTDRPTNKSNKKDADKGGEDESGKTRVRIVRKSKPENESESKPEADKDTKKVVRNVKKEKSKSTSIDSEQKTSKQSTSRQSTKIADKETQPTETKRIRIKRVAKDDESNDNDEPADKKSTKQKEHRSDRNRDSSDDESTSNSTSKSTIKPTDKVRKTDKSDRTEKADKTGEEDEIDASSVKRIRIVRKSQVTK